MGFSFLVLNEDLHEKSLEEEFSKLEDAVRSYSDPGAVEDEYSNYCQDDKNEPSENDDDK